MDPRQRTVLLILSFLFFGLVLTVRSFSESKKHPFPIYDEVHFLEIARDIRESGGILPTIKDYLQAKNLEDNRHPLYPMLLSFFVDRSPTDFSKAKILSLVLCLVLIGLVQFLCARRWGEAVGVIAGGLLSFSFATVHLSHVILADILFAIFLFLAFMKMIEIEDSIKEWALLGLWVGLAYLSKGSGHLLLLGVLAVGLYRAKTSFLSKPHPYVCLGVFILVAGFLLIRNYRVWGEPFYNFNQKIFWLDQYEYHFLLKPTPIWQSIGLFWYFNDHTVGDFVIRLFIGTKSVLRLTLEALSFTSVSKPADMVGGVAVVGLAGAGLVGFAKRGLKRELIAVASLFIPFFLAYSFFTEQTIRYVYVLTILLTPVAAYGIVFIAQRFIPNALRYAPHVFVGGFTAVAIGYQSVLFQNPVRYYLEPPAHWSETTDWIEKNTGAGGVVMNTWSYYSTWNSSKKSDLRPMVYAVDQNILSKWIQMNGALYVMLDQSFVKSDPFQEKYGIFDAYGPTTFISLDRCFHDSNKPSQFLIYSDQCKKQNNLK